MTKGPIFLFRRVLPTPIPAGTHMTPDWGESFQQSTMQIQKRWGCKHEKERLKINLTSAERKTREEKPHLSESPASSLLTTRSGNTLVLGPGLMVDPILPSSIYPSR